MSPDGLRLFSGGGISGGNVVIILGVVLFVWWRLGMPGRRRANPGL